jgi:tetratricopeptide (TPR) repeat protein
MYFTPTEEENMGYAAGCLADIALAKKEIGDSDGAIATMERALALVRRISNEDYRSRALKVLAVAQTRFGDYVASRQVLDEITRESDRRWAQKEIAELQARAGCAAEAVRTVETALIERRKLFDELAQVFSEIGDREGLKRLLRPCAHEINSAYHLCGLLAKSYPEQLTPLAEAVVNAESN